MIKFVALFAMAFGIYIDERGKNEWTIENIGEVTDAVFVGKKQSYMLSDDNLLTYFANTAMKPVWRKELPTNSVDDTYSLRYINDLIIALSNDRAIMINPAG